MNIEVGKRYAFDHSRKGRFTGTVHKVDGDFITLLIDDGTDYFIAQENARVGDEVIINKWILSSAPVEI